MFRALFTLATTNHIWLALRHHFGTPVSGRTTRSLIDRSSKRVCRRRTAFPTKMRVFQLLAAAFVSISAVSARKANSAFDVYVKKPAPVVLNEQQYEEITSAPRDYYAAVILTALDAKYACGICREFQPEWDIIGKSWHKKGDHRVLFGTLDFDQGRNVFMKVRTIVSV